MKFDLKNLSPFQARRDLSLFLGVKLPIRAGEYIIGVAHDDDTVVVAYRRTVITPGRHGRERQTVSLRVQRWERRTQRYVLSEETTTVVMPGAECVSADTPDYVDQAARERWLALGRPYDRHGYRTPVTRV